MTTGRELRELWLTLKESEDKGAMTICFAPFSPTRHVNRTVVGGKAGTGWWGWGGAAAVCRLLEDRASPSHLLITVVSETQQANNCSAATACWRLR